MSQRLALLAVGLLMLSACDDSGGSTVGALDAGAELGDQVDVTADAGDAAHDSAGPDTPIDPCEGVEPPEDTCTVLADVDGECVETFLPDGTACDDGDICSETSSCADGVCSGLEFIECDDDEPCTTDDCDPADGCFYTARLDGKPCTFGTACIHDATCEAGVCPRVEVECGDGNPCTEDRCLAHEGCRYVVLDGEPCDDGDACTDGDTCSGVTCAGMAVPGCE